MPRKLKAMDTALLAAFGVVFVLGAFVHIAYAIGKRDGIAEQTALVLDLRGTVP